MSYKRYQFTGIICMMILGFVLHTRGFQILKVLSFQKDLSNPKIEKKMARKACSHSTSSFYLNDGFQFMPNCILGIKDRVEMFSVC